MAPHELAVAGADADRRPRSEVHDRADAPHISRDARRIGRPVTQVFRPPDLLAGHLIERDYTRAPAARRDDQTVAVNQRGFADQPLGVASSELFQNILAPDRRAVARVQTSQVAVFSQRVNAVVINRWGRAGPVATTFFQLRSQGSRPDRLAVGAIQTKDYARARSGPLRVDAVGCPEIGRAHV